MGAAVGAVEAVGAVGAADAATVVGACVVGAAVEELYGDRLQDPLQLGHSAGGHDHVRHLRRQVKFQSLPFHFPLHQLLASFGIGNRQAGLRGDAGEGAEIGFRERVGFGQVVGVKDSEKGPLK